MNKIISYSNPTAEGITLEFSEPISLNDGMSKTEWWLSWEKLSELIFSKHLST